MTATTTPSAYPRTVDELIPHARDLAASIGEIPSRNTLMKTFKIGGPKAKELIAALTPAPAASTTPDPEPATAPVAAPGLPALPVPVDAATHGPDCFCGLCAHIREALIPVEPTVPEPVEPEPTADPVPPVEPTPAADSESQPVPAEPTSGASDDMTAYRNGAGDLMVIYRNGAGDMVTERVSAAPESIRHRARTAGFLDTIGTDPPALPADDAEPAAAEAPVEPEQQRRRRPIVWPVLILCLPAFVAIWGGWVEMGRLTGFGMVTLLPGISDFQINTAITLPIGVETYAAYALYVWLSGLVTGAALTFAKWSALASLLLGALGQVTYHLMAAWGWPSAPWPITAAVACIPVAVLGMGAGLAHLMHRSH